MQASGGHGYARAYGLNVTPANQAGWHRARAFCSCRAE